MSVHPADLAEAAAVSGLAATLESNGVTVDMLINSAGVGSRGNFVDEDPATIGSQIQVDCLDTGRGPTAIPGAANLVIASGHRLAPRALMPFMAERYVRT